MCVFPSIISIVCLFQMCLDEREQRMWFLRKVPVIPPSGPGDAGRGLESDQTAMVH